MRELSICDSFSPLPIIETDEERIVSDWNIAADCLLGPTLSDSLGRQIIGLIEELADGRAPKATRSSALTEITDWEIKHEFPEFGLVSGEISLVEEWESVAKLFVRIEHVERAAEFDRRFDSEVERELIWESYAMSYDRVLLNLPFYIQVVSRHRKALLEHGAKNILDIGAGTGNLALELMDAGCQVTAIDNSRGMLRCFRAKLSEILPARRPAIYRQEAEFLTAAVGKLFDGVNVLLAFFAMRNPRVALERAVQCLRPAGVMVITEPRRSFNMKELLSFAEQALREAGVLDRLREDWNRVFAANQIIDPTQRESLPVEAIASELETMKFRIIQVADSHYGNCATVVAVKPDAK